MLYEVITSDERINYELPSATNCNPDNITYSTCTKPILDAKCIGCHKTGKTYGNVKLDTYADFQKNYTRSMSQINAGTMPPAGYTLCTSSEISTLKNWDLQGQKE